jgi:hypothetical protein
MFDKNMLGPLRTLIHLKGVERLGSKTSNAAKPMETKFFSRLDPREDGHSLGHAQGKMAVTLDLANC